MEISKFILSGLLITTVFFLPKNLVAQGGEMRRDASKIIEAEKSILTDSLTSLSDDQKLIIDQIYKDFENEFTAARASVEPGNREVMMLTMQKIRESKNESLKAILTEEQYKKFEDIMKKMRQSRGRNRDGN